jgi:hypothetical protein
MQGIWGIFEKDKNGKDDAEAYHNEEQNAEECLQGRNSEGIMREKVMM